MSSIYDQCKNIIEISADSVFDAEKIESFLTVCAYTWHQDYYNQLLIWHQNSSSTDVCGAKAWQERGRNVLSGEKPIVVLNADFSLMTPSIPKTDEDGNPLIEESTGVELWESEPVWKAGLKPVPVFDVSQTEGTPASLSRPECSIINDVIRGRMGITVIDADAADLPLYHAFLFDEEKSLLYIKNNLDEKAKEQEALRFLVEHRSLELTKDVPDNIQAVTVFSGYILEKIFQMSGKNIIRGIAGKLKAISLEEKKRLLMTVNLFVKLIMAETTGIYLNFTETSAVNHLLDTDQRTMIPIHMEQAARSFRKEHPEIARSVTQFYKEKAAMATERSLSRLYMDKWRMAVFSYPPYPLEEEKRERQVKDND